MLVLLKRYNISDPAANTGVGEFGISILQNLYDDLVASGSPNLTDALIVGVTVEELDIFDINLLESQLEGNADIALVYSNLKKGSRNHLRAFYSRLIDNNGTYSPQYLSQSEFDAIINSDMERGN